MIRHMRHGSPPRLMALQSILSPNRRESLPTPSAGVRIRRGVSVRISGSAARYPRLLLADGARLPEAGLGAAFVPDRDRELAARKHSPGIEVEPVRWPIL